MCAVVWCVCMCVYVCGGCACMHVHVHVCGWCMCVYVCVVCVSVCVCGLCMWFAVCVCVRSVYGMCMCVYVVCLNPRPLTVSICASTEPYPQAPGFHYDIVTGLVNGDNLRLLKQWIPHPPKKGNFPRKSYWEKGKAPTRQKTCKGILHKSNNLSDCLTDEAKAQTKMCW